MKKIVYKIARVLLSIILPMLHRTDVTISSKEAEKEIEKLYKNDKIVVHPKIENQDKDNDLDLSIIVPVYNAEKLLESCMDSIMNQKTKYHFEVIVINDGSTDNSLKILEKYSSIKIINKENEGVAVARNVGLNHAKGKYIAFIDSDDRIDESYVQKLLTRAYEKNADIVKCNFVEYAVDKNEIIKYERHDDVSISGELKEKIIEFKGFVWGGIFKRDLWFDVRFLPQYWYEDMLIRFILFRKCKQFEYINEDLYCYNNHSKNISKSISRTENIRCLDHLFLVRELLKISDTLGLKKDSTLYKVLLQELGPLLWLRTRDLSKKNKQCTFVLACDIIEEYKARCDLQFSEKYLEKAFLKRNFILWKLSSIYVMLGVKIGNE